MGTGCWEKGTFSHYDLLCQLEANTTLLVRCLRHVYRLHREEVQHQHSKAAAQEKGKKRRAISSSPCNSSSSVRLEDWLCERQR